MPGVSYDLLQVTNASDLDGFQTRQVASGVSGTSMISLYFLMAEAADKKVVLNFDASRDISEFGSTRNQAAAAGAIAGQANNGNSGLFDAVAASGSVAAIEDALTQLAADGHATTVSALLHMGRRAMRSITTRLARTAPLTSRNLLNMDSAMHSADTALASFGDCADDNRFWVSAGGFRTNLDGSRDAGKAKMKGPETTLGYTAGLAGGWLAGAALRYNRTDIDSRNYSADVDTYGLTVFAGREWFIGNGGVGRMVGGALFDLHDVDTARTVAFTGFNERSKADYKACTTQLFAEFAYNFNAGCRVNLEPYAGLDYSHFRAESLRENGGVSAVRVDRESRDNAFSTVGVRATTRVTDWMRANADVAWQHTYGNTKSFSALMLHEGGRFTTRGSSVSRDTLLVEAGVTFAVGSTMEAGLNYSGAFGDLHTSNGGNLSFSLSW